MKQRILLSVISLVIVLATMFSLTSCVNGLDDTKYAVISENNLSDDGLVYSIYENKTAIITGRQVDYPEVIIPDEINGYPVVEVGDGAFEKDETIVILTLGKNLKIVRDNAFSECTSLARVQASENLKMLCSGAFYGCSRLTEVIGATKLIHIDEVAFYNCTALAYFDFPETLTTIKAEAFSGCESLTKAELPAKITEIGDGAFSYCLSLTRVSMGNLKKIPNRLFLNCTALEYVEVPKVSSIGAHAFRGCSNLKKLYVPKTVKSVGEACFAQCEKLSTVYYGGSEGAFAKIEYGAENDFFSGASIVYNQKLS